MTSIVLLPAGQPSTATLSLAAMIASRSEHARLGGVDEFSSAVHAGRDAVGLESVDALQFGNADAFAPVEKVFGQNKDRRNTFGQKHRVFDGLWRRAKLKIAPGGLHQVAAARQFGHSMR